MKTKTFDCVRMKEEIQAKFVKNSQGLTAEEEIGLIRRALHECPELEAKMGRLPARRPIPSTWSPSRNRPRDSRVRHPATRPGDRARFVVLSEGDLVILEAHRRPRPKRSPRAGVGYPWAGCGARRGVESPPRAAYHTHEEVYGDAHEHRLGR